MKTLAITNLLGIMLIILFIIGWGMNLYKLTQCDFEAPYKAETIHTIGVLPVVGAVTGWMDFGK